MFKKSEREKQESVFEKIEVFFLPGKLVFKIGEKEFYLDEKTANFLFGGQRVKYEFERLSGQHETFEEFSTDDFLAKFQACWTHFADAHEVAKFLGMNEGRLRRWIGNLESRAWRSDKLMRPEIQSSIEKYRKELFPEVKEKEKPVDLDLKKIAEKLKEGKRLDVIYSELKIKASWQEFIKNYTANLAEIQKIMNRENLQDGHIGSPEFFGKT